MPPARMHDDEIEIGAALVGRLIGEQFPHWASLPIKPVNSAGTDNALYRLGDDKVARLPRRPGMAAQIDKEARWLPVLAAHLPLAVPLPLAMGRPTAEYPCNWSVCRWLEGRDAVIDPIADLNDAAIALAGFVNALQRIDATGGPAPGNHNFFRGVPLAHRDAQTRDAIDRLHGIIDTDAALGAWQAALAAPAWSGPPVWLHGDIHAGNLLVRDGHITAVIDFGGLAVGDPACDLMVGWNLLSGESRAIFRAALSVDDATWARARSWALSVALIALPYYLDTNPVLVGISRHAIGEVLSEF